MELHWKRKMSQSSYACQPLKSNYLRMIALLRIVVVSWKKFDVMKHGIFEEFMMDIYVHSTERNQQDIIKRFYLNKQVPFFARIFSTPLFVSIFNLYNCRKGQHNYFILYIDFIQNQIFIDYFSFLEHLTCLI